MDNQFKQYQLKPFVIAGLDAMGITQPTPIQKKVIPALLRGENLQVKAKPVVVKPMPFWSRCLAWLTQFKTRPKL